MLNDSPYCEDYFIPSTGDTIDITKIKELIEEAKTTSPNYNVMGNNGERRIFKIHVGNINEDEIQEAIKEITKKFKS